MEYSGLIAEVMASPAWLVSVFNCKSLASWIIERLDRKLADVIGSNIVGKCDVTSSRAFQPLTSDVFASDFLAQFTIYRLAMF